MQTLYRKVIKNEIVSLSTQDVSRAIPITTSELVAKAYDVKHHAIQQLINKYEKDFQEFGKVAFEMRASKSGQTEKIFFLTEDQFYLLVTYMKNTEIARRAKIEFVKAFSKAKKELLARSETRKVGITVGRISMTDSIRDHVSPEGNFKKFAYGNYTKLVYKRVLGMDVKHAKEARKCPETGNLRDYLTIDELDHAQELESKIATFIEMTDTDGKNDKQIYQMVKAWLDSTKSETGC